MIILKKSATPSDNSSMNRPTEQEIRDLDNRLTKLTAFVSDFGPKANFAPDALKGYGELCGMSDGLSWVLGELAIDEIYNGAISDLTEWIKIIEQRTGQKLDNYE
jgi:hypothetical protein